MKMKAVTLAAVLMLAPFAMRGQSTTTPPPSTAPPAVTPAPAAPITGRSIHERKERQQARIAQGIKNGSLSPAETARLEHQEAGINQEERGDRAQNNGKLTGADKRLINKQQNQESRRIHREKHDGPAR